MTEDGITTILLYLDKNHRSNYYLSKKIADLTLDDLSKDEIILDESYLAKLQDNNEIDKIITTAIIDDAYFFNTKLKDDIFGNSLKEVIKKKPKKWMVQKKIEKTQPRPKKFLTLHEFMLRFDEENRRRGRFLRRQRMGFPDFDPRFALLNRNRMHRRRRLRRFGYERFPYTPFGGFGMPPSMRAFSVPPFPPHGPPFMHPPYGEEFGRFPYGHPPHMGPPPFAHPHMSPPSFGHHPHYGAPHFGGADIGYHPMYPKEYDRRYENYDNIYMRNQNIYGNMNYTDGNIVLRARPDQKNKQQNTKDININIKNENYITHSITPCRPIQSKNVEQDAETGEKKEEKKENLEKIEEEEDDDDEDVLIPDEHPEETTSLE
jgi:hypothetical protein